MAPPLPLEFRGFTATDPPLGPPQQHVNNIDQSADPPVTPRAASPYYQQKIDPARPQPRRLSSADAAFFFFFKIFVRAYFLMMVAGTLFFSIQLLATMTWLEVLALSPAVIVLVCVILLGFGVCFTIPIEP